MTPAHRGKWVHTRIAQSRWVSLQTSVFGAIGRSRPFGTDVHLTDDSASPSVRQIWRIHKALGRPYQGWDILAALCDWVQQGVRLATNRLIYFLGANGAITHCKAVLLLCQS